MNRTKLKEDTADDFKRLMIKIGLADAGVGKNNQTVIFK